MKTNETKQTKEVFKSYLVDGVDSAWRKDNAWRKANKAWLRKSAKIALKINRFLKDHKITQRQLAKTLEVSPQQVNKLLKGRENLTLETVSKLETILGIELISIVSSKEIEDRINTELLEYHRKWTKTVEYKNKSGIVGDLSAILCVNEVEEEYALAG